MIENNKLRFSLRSAARGGFRAQGLDVPITADATSLSDLRAKLAAATRSFFGHDREFSILVGVKDATPAHVGLPDK